jgi:electron transport complex protein RnfE
VRVVQEFSKGLFKENPVFRLLLGLCPTLAVTASVRNGIGMGLAATFVLVASNFMVSMVTVILRLCFSEETFKKIQKIRIPIFIIVIATFVTIIDLAMAAYYPELHKELGIFVPLIVVNCIILGRAEAFASKNNPFMSVVDGIGMGLGFTLSLSLIGFIREMMGSGTVLMGTPAMFKPFGGGFQPALLMVLPPGAFLSLGLLLGLINNLVRRGNKR